MLRILCENTFEESIWCQKIYEGLICELKKRRIAYEKVRSTDSVLCTDSVYIIGSSHIWINHAISLCNEKAVVPVILCNQVSNLAHGRYHCVCTDTLASMEQLICASNLSDIKRVALYGVNNTSISDVSRAKIYIEITKNPESVFTNNGSLENCFDSFINHISKYDTVICVNNYAAISLVKKLADKKYDELERLNIVSCSSSKLSSIFSRFITSVNMNFEQYGKAALSISELCAKNPYISGITVMISWDSGSFDTKISPKLKSDDIADIDRFYEDDEVKRLLKVERLLNICNDTDIKILQMLIEGKTYEAIAESCFLSKESIKYHIKKYISTCRVNSKNELIKTIEDFYPFSETKQSI
ncbi:MAG: hypothetical protein IJ460_00010 [Clostridia bacterium]|nr:hypothetical protein [Clostridia bacterium]